MHCLKKYLQIHPFYCFVVEAFDISHHIAHPTSDYSLSSSGHFHMRSIHLCRQSPVSSMGCAGLLAFSLRASSESTGRTGQKCRGLMPTENNAPPVGGSGCTDGHFRRLSIGFSEVLAEVSPYG